MPGKQSTSYAALYSAYSALVAQVGSVANFNFSRCIESFLLRSFYAALSLLTLAAALHPDVQERHQEPERKQAPPPVPEMYFAFARLTMAPKG